jgi:hypothetical protein
MSATRWVLLCGFCCLVSACIRADSTPAGGLGTGDGGSGTFVPEKVGPGAIASRDDDAGEASAATDAGGGASEDCRERTRIEKLDLLFVVDNSNSMTEEQSALQAQFPKLIETLTSGERFPGDPSPFALIKDVHLAVVSSDMGLVGVSGIQGCQGFGDDGIMKSPALQGCSGTSSDERFLSYEAGKGDPGELAFNFGCVAMLGTGGCGFEQPLEAGLKALWPGDDAR